MVQEKENDIIKKKLGNCEIVSDKMRKWWSIGMEILSRERSLFEGPGHPQIGS